MGFGTHVFGTHAFGTWAGTSLAFATPNASNRMRVYLYGRLRFVSASSADDGRNRANWSIDHIAGNAPEGSPTVTVVERQAFDAGRLLWYVDLRTDKRLVLGATYRVTCTLISGAPEAPGIYWPRPQRIIRREQR